MLTEEEIPKDKTEIKKSEITDDGEIEILDEEIPFGAPMLPKTGSVGGLLGIGITMLAAGFYLVKKEDEE